MTRTIMKKADVIPLVTEVFRELGFEGASLSRITDRTGISKGSLYYFFPGGKDDMASEILTHIDAWFVNNIFEPLERDEPYAAINNMWREVDAYFHSGQRICLVGAFSLDETRDLFAATIRNYFKRWIDALHSAMVRAGAAPDFATSLAEEVVGGIQGGLILAKALNDDGAFTRTLARLAKKLEAACFKSNTP